MKMKQTDVFPQLEMETMIARGQISHFYLIHGENSKQNDDFMYFFVRRLLSCELDFEKNEHLFDMGNHPDVIFVKGEAGKQSIGVKEIRQEIIASLYVRPILSTHKFYLLSDCNRLTEQAQNALLKSLESPPSYAIFIFTCTQLLPLQKTLLSRAFVISKTKTDDDPSRDNSVSLTIEQLFKRYIERNRHMDFNELFLIAKEFETYKEHALEIYELFFSFFRDILLYQQTHSTEFFVCKEFVTIIEKEAGHFQHVYQMIDEIKKQILSLRHPVNFLPSFERLLILIKENTLS